MPRMIETPIVLSQVNHYQITGVNLHLRAAPSCTIQIDRGHKQGNTLTPVDTVYHTVSGAPMLQAMQAATSGDAIYDELKALLYAQCVADGVIPAEAVDVEA